MVQEVVRGENTSSRKFPINCPEWAKTIFRVKCNYTAFVPTPLAVLVAWTERTFRLFLLLSVQYTTTTERLALRYHARTGRSYRLIYGHLHRMAWARASQRC